MTPKTTAISVTPYASSKSEATKYRARTYIYLPTAKRKRIDAYGRTKTIAREKLQAKAAELTSRNPNRKTITVLQLTGLWLTYLKAQGRKRKTIDDYAKGSRNHVLPKLGDKQAHTISTAELRQLIHGILEPITRKNGTTHVRYRTAELIEVILSGIFKHGAKLFEDFTDPTAKLEPIKRPHQEDPKDQIWTLEQMQHFLELSKKNYDNLKSLYYPIYYMAMSTGLRRGELLALEWRHIIKTGEGYQITVRQQYTRDSQGLYLESPKSKSGIRDVPISQSLFELLMSHRELLRQLEQVKPDYQKTNLVFPTFNGTVIEPRNLTRSFAELYQKAGLPPIYFHNLRKCAATYITQNLVNAGRYAPKIVQNILGHSRIDVALETYTKLIDDDKKLAVFDPFGGTSGGTEKEEDEVESA